MKVYYNEIDPFAAQWLRNLITAGHIPAGDVDERSIEDVHPADLDSYDQCHFFAGIGGWSYALRLAGYQDRKIWTGSCPCQPFSTAGKGGGFDDERHLWPAFFHLIQQCQPAVIVGEQVASQDGLAWLDLVQTDLENSDHAFAAVDLCAAGVKAPHPRQRIYWVAVSNRHGRWTGSETAATVGQRASIDSMPADGSLWSRHHDVTCCDGRIRPVEPGTFPLAYGVPARVGRLRGYGNAIVPQVAASFLSSLPESIFP